MGYEDESGFSPLSKSVMASTLDFDPSGILLEIGSIPLTVSQSISGVFPEGHRL